MPSSLEAQPPAAFFTVCHIQVTVITLGINRRRPRSVNVLGFPAVRAEVVRISPLGIAVDPERLAAGRALQPFSPHISNPDSAGRGQAPFRHRDEGLGFSVVQKREAERRAYPLDGGQLGRLIVAPSAVHPVQGQVAILELLGVRQVACHDNLPLSEQFPQRWALSGYFFPHTTQSGIISVHTFAFRVYIPFGGQGILAD